MVPVDMRHRWLAPTKRGIGIPADQRDIVRRLDAAIGEMHLNREEMEHVVDDQGCGGVTRNKASSILVNPSGEDSNTGRL